MKLLLQVLKATTAVAEEWKKGGGSMSQGVGSL